MHPADIKAALAKSGRTQASVAKELQVTPVTVHQVIFGSVHSRRVANLISEITGHPLNELWPGAYDIPRPAPAPDSPTEALV